MTEPQEVVLLLRNHHLAHLTHEQQWLVTANAVGWTDDELGQAVNKSAASARREVGHVESLTLDPLGLTEKRLVGWWCGFHTSCCLSAVAL